MGTIEKGNIMNLQRGALNNNKQFGEKQKTSRNYPQSIHQKD